MVVTDSRHPTEASKYARLDLIDKARILLLREEGYTQTEIAEQLGCSQSSVSETLKHFKNREEDAIRLLLVGHIEERLANWDKAEKVAADRGDHRPTKERLEMAIKKLRPQAAEKSGDGGRVTIHIGTMPPPGMTVEEMRIIEAKVALPAGDGQKR